MELFTTTLDLYGGVLWSGELQGFIIQQMMPSLAPSWLQEGDLGFATALPPARPGGVG